MDNTPALELVAWIMAHSHLPVTYETIAAATGTSKATVSRALRNDPRISAETRSRVLTAAKELGYQSDPALSALAAYRKRKRGPADHGKLAVLNAWGVAKERELPEFFRKQLLGVRERAGELGYQIELFGLPEDGHGQIGVSRMLFARGIQGVLVGPVPVHMAELHLDWSYFATAVIGRSLVRPELHCASSDRAWSVEMLYQKLHMVGYRNIGYCHDNIGELRGGHEALSSYLKCRFLDGKSRGEPPPPLLLDEDGADDPVVWVGKHRIDAVICGGVAMEPLEARLTAEGYSIPRDVGLVSLSLRHDDLRHAGVQEDMPGLGRAAVSLLHNMLVNWERGIPEPRHIVLVRGRWQEGQTARPAPAGPC